MRWLGYLHHEAGQEPAATRQGGEGGADREGDRVWQHAQRGLRSLRKKYDCREVENRVDGDIDGDEEARFSAAQPLGGNSKVRAHVLDDQWLSGACPAAPTGARTAWAGHGRHARQQGPQRLEDAHV